MSHATLPSDLSTVRDPRNRSKLYSTIGICVGLVLAVALVYGRTLRHGFTNFDDGLFVSNQPRVLEGLTWRGLIWAFTSGPEGDWCPLAMLSHMLDCQLFDMDPAGHHLTNLVLHAISSVALFLVLWRMTGQRAVPEVAQASGARVAAASPSATFWPSALVAAIFALHPLHVESVAWIAERRDVLSGLLFVLTLGAYNEYARHPRSPLRYLAVIVCFTLGLLAKSMLVTLPGVLLLLDDWPLGRMRAATGTRSHERGRFLPWRLVWEKLPLFALSAAMIAVTLLSHRVEAFNPVLRLPERFADAAVSCVAYLGQLLVPVGMSIFYPYPEVGRPIWQVAGAAVVLLAITLAAAMLRRTEPYLFVGWFWFLGMLLPVLEVIPVGAHARADRYTYLSQIGLYIALVWGARRLTAAWPARRWMLPVGAALALVALAACSWRQVGFWQSNEALWMHALDCDPANVPAHYHLALDLRDKDTARAVDECRSAVELAPGQRNLYYGTRAQAYLLLADVANHRDDPAQAIACCEQALEMCPDFGQALTLLGRLLVKQGNFSQAIERLRRCTELEPDNPATWCNLAWAQTHAGHNDEAIEDYRRAIKLGRDDATPQRGLASLLASLGKFDAAIDLLRRAIQIEPRTPSSYFQMAGLLRSQGKLSEARDADEQGRQAGRRYAHDQVQHGLELARQGSLDEAARRFQQAIEAAPDNVAAYDLLADVLERADRSADSLAVCRAALTIDPEDPQARRRLERLLKRQTSPR